MTEGWPKGWDVNNFLIVSLAKGFGFTCHPHCQLCHVAMRTGEPSPTAGRQCPGGRRVDIKEELWVPSFVELPH